MSEIYNREWQGNFSEKEKLFLLDYAKSGDKEASAEAVGYAENAIIWIGDKILGRPEARAELELIRREQGNGSGMMTQEELSDEFRLIAQASITDFYDELGNVVDVTEMDPVKARSIKEIKRTVNPKTGAVTVTVTMHDKIAALQNLGRIGGYFAADNNQDKGPVTINFLLPGGMSKL